MMHNRRPAWKAAGGYTVNEESGIAERCRDRACTLHFYLAEPGDSIQLLDQEYAFAVATYLPARDPKYIYTYEYQPEENWTEYRHDFSEERFLQGEYVFTERVYFRVILKKMPDGNGVTLGSGDIEAGQVSFGLSEILQRHAGSKLLPSAPADRLESITLSDYGRQGDETQWGEELQQGDETQRGEELQQGDETQRGEELQRGDETQWGEEAQQKDETQQEKDIQNEISLTAASVCAKQQGDSLNFILLTDNHYTVNGTWEQTAENLYRTAAALKKRGVNLDGFLHLGDATDGMVPAEITKDYIAAMQEDIRVLGIPLYYVIGNHDSNYFRNNPDRFCRQEIRKLYLPERERCYYYQDVPGRGLRMIFLESFDPSEKIRYGFHEEELEWLEELLDRTDSGWYVLVFSHVPPVPRLHYWSKEIRGSRRLLRILREYQNRTSGHLLGYIHGHNHADQTDNAEGFPIISIGCNKCEYFQDKKPEGAVAYSRVPGEVSQDLWDILTVSVRSGTLDFTRFGAGEDRRISREGPEAGKTGNAPARKSADAPSLAEPEAGKTGNVPARKSADALRLGEPEAGRTGKVPAARMRETAMESPGGSSGAKSAKSRSWLREQESESMEREPKNVAPGQRGRKSAGGNRERNRPMKKVITYGSFDLFHEGHYNILKRAKELGDYLIVGVTTEHYDEQRGKLNIVDPLLERIENVRHTGLVDEIIIEDHEGQKIEDVQKYGVDIFVLGSDWIGVYDYLKAYCQVIYLERTPDISSTMLRKEKFPIIRMGVVGSGRIAPRFLSEAKYVSGVNVQCVYNPHRDSAEAFGEKYLLESYSGRFETFLDTIDAIYIAAPHETHYDYTRRALLAGKHVLCEKPMAFTRSQAEELFSLARQRQLILMEGIKTAFCPGFAQMISIAKSGKIGVIRDVEACFSRLTPPDLREMQDVRYGGAFMEFGSYTVLPVLKLLGLDYKDIRFRSIRAENGVDLYTKVYFDYEDGMATSKTGLGVKSEGQLLISGTKGYILAESPWWLTRKFQVRYEDPGRIETYTPNFLGDGLRYEIGEFISRINGRSGNVFKLTEEESVAMADVVERFLEERAGQRAEARRRDRSTGIRIWGHRGCSYRYPENTLAAFRAACELPGLAGIELDIQLSKDGEIVVFHDETLDRLMDRDGNLRDYTLGELQQMKFRDWEKHGGALEETLSREAEGRQSTPEEQAEDSAVQYWVRIPSMREVFDLVKPYALKKGIRINIELKNSNFPYEGMEEKILSLAAEYGMEDYVVYSSFNSESVRRLKELDGRVRTGILHSDVGECRCLASEAGADALHPDVENLLKCYETAKGAAAGEAEADVENLLKRRETAKGVVAGRPEADVENLLKCCETAKGAVAGRPEADVEDLLKRCEMAKGVVTGRPEAGEEACGYNDVIVRAWNCREPFYGQMRQYVIYDLEKLGKAGVTDFITNVPEEYLED